MGSKGEKSGIQTDFSPRTSVFLCQYHFTNAVYSCFVYLPPTPCKLNFSVVKSNTSLFRMEKSPSREVNNALVEKFPAYYGTRICLTAFTAACWGVSKLRKMDPLDIIPQHLFKIHFNIVLPFLNQGLPRRLFPSCLLTKIPHALFLLHPSLFL